MYYFILNQCWTRSSVMWDWHVLWVPTVLKINLVVENQIFNFFLFSFHSSIIQNFLIYILGIYSKNIERIDWSWSIENNEPVCWVSILKTNSCSKGVKRTPDFQEKSGNSRYFTTTWSWLQFTLLVHILWQRVSQRHCGLLVMEMSHWILKSDRDSTKHSSFDNKKITQQWH